MIIAVPGSSKEAAKLLVVIWLPRLRKYIASRKPSNIGNVKASYDQLIKEFFKLHPTFEKLTRKSEFNINGDCSALIKRLTNGK